MQALLQPNTIAREKLERGHHIFAYRRGYPVHGINDGEGKVIHFISSPSEYFPAIQCADCGGDNQIPGVIIRCIRCFLAGAETAEPYLYQYGVPPPLFLARLRGGTCTLAHADGDAMHRALQLLRNSAAVSNYGSFFVNSPEDFAVYCKTGLLVVGGASRSGHAAAAVTAAMAVAASPLRNLLGFAGSAFVGVGVHCVTRLAEDFGVRRDVIKDAVKVPVEHLLDGSVSST